MTTKEIQLAISELLKKDNIINNPIIKNMEVQITFPFKAGSLVVIKETKLDGIFKALVYKNSKTGWQFASTSSLEYPEIKSLADIESAVEKIYAEIDFAVMTISDLIPILKQNEFGTNSVQKELSVSINGKDYIPNPKFELLEVTHLDAILNITYDTIDS